jgi:uncharacterized protein YeaO (DUF488 family)
MEAGGIPMPKIRLKRAYDEASPDDGVRVLVERLWPRGLTKERAAIDIWMKDVAPSQELRRWYSHDIARWIEFKKRYRAELDENEAAVDELRKKCRTETVTFIYAASDEQHNSALLLKDYLEGHAS